MKQSFKIALTAVFLLLLGATLSLNLSSQCNIQSKNIGFENENATYKIFDSVNNNVYLNHQSGANFSFSSNFSKETFKANSFAIQILNSLINFEWKLFVSQIKSSFFQFVSTDIIFPFHFFW